MTLRSTPNPTVGTEFHSEESSNDPSYFILQKKPELNGQRRSGLDSELGVTYLIIHLDIYSKVKNSFRPTLIPIYLLHIV